MDHLDTALAVLIGLCIIGVIVLGATDHSTQDILLLGTTLIGAAIGKQLPQKVGG